ncbi:MAG TPA: alpha/beta hydrolase domain-containing protein [Methylomirabilota bacterium]|nr:alpha/beta hydrolase domain-containing protein [Methylomirabilota bacterium]
MSAIAFDVTLHRPLAAGAPFGDAGPYEELRGRLRFAVDPAHAANRGITDIALAPTNASGRVEFAADLSLLLPVDRTRCSGRVLVDVVNRGNTVSVPNFNHATRPVFGPGSDPHPPIDVGDGFLMRRGWVVASCGWQGDLPDLPGLLRLYGVDAQAHGAPLRGRVYVQCQAPEDVAHFLLSDRGHQPYRAADLDERDAVLTVRDMPDDEPEVIARDRWRFAHADGGRVVADPTHVWLEGGFARGRLYHVAYTAVGAPVMGLGMAALRDCAAWLKHGDRAAGHPASGALRWAYAYGRSQTGRLLRTLLHYDLNTDESGREAFDGILANVAGGMRGEFNQRFGQNSKDRPWAMCHLEPFQVEPRGRVKVFYTNTAAEYHRGDASLIHTDPDGARDVEHGPSVRVYHFAGTEHGLGVWPPTDTQTAAADPHGWSERSRHLRGVVNYGRLLRACLLNLDRWVTEGAPPPPSRHPRLADGTAVDPESLAKTFDAIPAARYPRRHARPRRVDFGADAEMRTVSTTPPRVGRAYGTRVSAVNADGNEIAGIVLPELAVPVATHTGWNLRHPDIGGDRQLLVFAGATLPFARTGQDREAAGDPRLSIAERYRSRQDYLARVRDAARALVKDGYLLEEDVETSAGFAARMWDAWA